SKEQFSSWMIQTFTIVSSLLFQKGLFIFVLVIIFLVLQIIFLLKDELIVVRFNKKEFLKIILKMLPVLVLLFIFFPRIPFGLNPYPVQSLNNNEGRVGFSTELDLSKIDSLELSYQEVFYAEMLSSINKQSLYWRGQTL